LVAVEAVIKPEQMADLIRRATELEHELRVFAKRMEGREGPLAVIANESLRRSATKFEQASESLRDAAQVATLVIGG
jgi:hypothetical protein